MEKAKKQSQSKNTQGFSMEKNLFPSPHPAVPMNHPAAASSHPAAAMNHPVEGSSKAGLCGGNELPLPEEWLPGVIRQIVMSAPPCRKMPVFVASLAPLCALAPRVRLLYPFDQRLSGLQLQVLMEGAQSSGKSFCSMINELIMGDVIREDQRQRRLEQEYREKKSKRRANEKLGDVPVTAIRVIPANVSKTVLVKRADYYQRIWGDTLTFWMFSEELAQVVDAGRQGYSNLRTIMRTAYDLGALFGLDFQSENSYSAIVDINISSLFCCTPSALNKYMDKESIEGGNVTRTILCQIEDGIGAQAAVFRPLTDDEQRQVDCMVALLGKETFASDGNLLPQHFVDMGWLEADVKQWTEEKGHEATLTGSVAMDVFRKRSSVSAFRVAALCYYLYDLEGKLAEEASSDPSAAASGKADGSGATAAARQGTFMQLDEADKRERCRLIYYRMADYILTNMLGRWGKRFEELNAENCVDAPGRSVRGLFYSLDDTFTRDQLKMFCDELKLTTPPRQFIYMWMKQHDIEQIDSKTFRKVKAKRQEAADKDGSL